MEKTLISEQKCVLTFRRYSDGTQNLEIRNEGMNQLELLGAAKILENNTLKESKDSHKIDSVKREAVHQGIKKDVENRVSTLDECFSESYHRPSSKLVQNPYKHDENQYCNLIKTGERESNLRNVKNAAQQLIDLLNLCKI